MKNLLGLGAAAALMLTPVSAMAADLAVVEPVPSFSWTGVYVGLQAAYHHGDVRASGCRGVCIRNHKVKDPFVAAVAGFDYQFDNNLVVGVTGGLGLTPIKSRAELIPGFDVKGKTTFGGFVGGRLGYAFDRFLPYGVVGYQYVRGKVTNEVVRRTIKKSHDGWLVGGGLEYAVTDNISIDGRYVYSRFEKKPYDFGGGVTRGGESAHNVSIGLNYRFNFGG